jgi:hypothetical protein
VAAVLGLEQRDLRNLNLGDLKKGPNGGVSPTPQKNLEQQTHRNYVDRHNNLICILGLFNDTSNILDNTASNYMIINEQQTGKNV